MEIFAGLQLAVILSIVGLSEKLKDLLPPFKHSKLYSVVPLLLSIPFAYTLTVPFVWQTFFFNVIIYFGISVLFYDTVVKYIEKKKEKLEEN